MRSISNFVYKSLKWRCDDRKKPHNFNSVSVFLSISSHSSMSIYHVVLTQESGAQACWQYDDFLLRHLLNAYCCCLRWRGILSVCNFTTRCVNHFKMKEAMLFHPSRLDSTIKCRQYLSEPEPDLPWNYIISVELGRRIDSSGSIDRRKFLISDPIMYVLATVFALRGHNWMHFALDHIVLLPWIQTSLS